MVLSGNGSFVKLLFDIFLSLPGLFQRDRIAVQSRKVCGMFEGFRFVHGPLMIWHVFVKVLLQNVCSSLKESLFTTHTCKRCFG